MKTPGSTSAGHTGQASSLTKPHYPYLQDEVSPVALPASRGLVRTRLDQAPEAPIKCKV